MRVIIGMTWKELLRKRVMILTLILTAVFLIAFWFVASTIGKNSFIGGNDVSSSTVLIAHFANGAFILNLGFFFGGFVIAFLAIFSSFSVISGEAEQGIMQALLPRPLPRWKWYMGRWLGYVSLGVLYALVLFISILLITGAHAAVPHHAGVLATSFLLFASVVPLLISLSMLGSGIFSALGNGVFMTMLYGAGWLGGMIDKVSGSLQLEGENIDLLNNMTGIMSLIMPVDGLQRKMSAELLSLDELNGMVGFISGTGGLLDISTAPANSFVVYAVCYTLLAFLIGLLRFQRKDL